MPQINIFKDDPYAQLFSSIPEPILVGYGGSYAYGTNVEGSDIDIRGICHETVDGLMGIKKSPEQYEDSATDTVIYSLRKAVKLLADCNPNVIEILGLRPQDYLAIGRPGKKLLYNKSLFLSKKAAITFGGYAKSQLNRLVNRSGRSKDHLLENETRSINKVIEGFVTRYDMTQCEFSASENENTINVSMRCDGIPIEQLSNMLNEINEVNNNYKKSTRNTKAMTRGKLSKHQMHLLRLYMMGIDILNKKEIITFREDEHDLLMSIRNGNYLEADGVTPTSGFEEILADYQKMFDEATRTTTLPDAPDYDKINWLVRSVNTELLKMEMDDMYD